MPYAQDRIPFNGSTPQTRHSSLQGAEKVRTSAPSLQLRYLAFLMLRGDRGATDQESAAYLGCKVTTVCARRAECNEVGLLEPCGTRPGDSGVDIVAWRLVR